MKIQGIHNMRLILILFSMLVIIFYFIGVITSIKYNYPRVNIYILIIIIKYGIYIHTYSDICVNEISVKNIVI